METLQQVIFRKRVHDVDHDVEQVATDLKLPAANRAASAAAAQALATDGVLVRVGCGSVEEFREQFQLLTYVLKSHLVDPDQPEKWINMFCACWDGVAEDVGRERGKRMAATGVELDLRNGSGVRVLLDDEVVAARSAAGRSGK